MDLPSVHPALASVLSLLAGLKASCESDSPLSMGIQLRMDPALPILSTPCTCIGKDQAASRCAECRGLGALALETKQEPYLFSIQICLTFVVPAQNAKLKTAFTFLKRFCSQHI